MAGNIGDLQVNLSANTSPMERDVSAALKRLESKGFNFGAGINAKAFTQPLGRITGAANEFQKSLDASNARVIAFGASAGAIYSIQKAFTSLISSTIEVQKSLTDINVILGASQKTLGQFGDSLFKIAKDSGQAFSTVATAAGELARQGLSVEQTLKRTSDALVLARLSGLDAASSVEALTASINSFNTSALDSTQIVNKLAAVDSAFAVSSGDLAEALKRVGSSAQDVGVSFDELLAIVASVNQTTARGGAVIGNSLKTIFTRVQRTEVLDQLESLGVAVRDLNGNTAPAIQVLTGLASKFDELGAAQKSQVAELVGGVFQINILKAALGDLSKQYSVYGNALKISQGATDEATRRNEELNKTLSALLNRTVANLTKVGSDIGSLSFAPAIEKVLGGINTALEAFDVKGDSIGGKIGKGIFEGIGSFVSGPGLAILIGVFLKIFGNLAKFTTEAVRTVLGLNKEAQAQAQIQERINSILSQNPQLIQNILNKQVSLLQVEKDILTVIQAQSQARAQSTAIAASLTRGLIGRGVTSEKGVITAKTKSQGFIPNFNANKEMMGAISGGYMPGQVRSMNIPNYGRVTYNDAETVKQFSGLSQPGIMPPANSDAGKAYKEKFQNKYGINPYASSGFVPNFAAGIRPEVQQRIDKAIASGKLTTLTPNKTGVLSNISPEESAALERAKKTILATRSTNNPTKITKPFDATSLGVLSLRGKSGDLSTSTSLATLPMFSDAVKADPSIGLNTVQFNGVQVRSLDALGKQKPNEFIQLLTQQLLPPLANVATQFIGSALGNQGDGVNEVLGKLKNGKTFLPPGTIGDLFETVVKIATKNPTKFLQSVEDDFRRPFDFEESGAASGQFKSRFGFESSLIKADAKLTSDAGAIRSIIKKAYNSNLDGLPFKELLNAKIPKTSSKKNKSQGFIPNFSPIDRALSTEGKMGGKGVLDFQQGVGLYVRDGKTQPNFAAVMRDHPEGIGNAVQNSKKMQSMMSAGFIPNFAGFDPMSLFYIMQSIGGSGRAAGAELELEKSKLDAILKDRIAAQQLLKVEEAKEIKDQAQINYLKNEQQQLLSQENAQRATMNSQMGVFARDKGGKISGGFGGALGRFGSRYGAGLALAAPLLADTAAQFIGDENTRGGRALKSGISGLGTTASYAGLGFQVGGGYGAAIGGGAGLAIGIYDVFKKLNDIMPDVARRLETATEKFNNISAATQTMSVSLETLSSIEGRADLSAQTRVQLRTKAEEDFAKSIAQLNQVLPGAGKQITDLYARIGDTAELRQKITQLQTEAQKESKGLAASANLYTNNQKMNDLVDPKLYQQGALGAGKMLLQNMLPGNIGVAASLGVDLVSKDYIKGENKKGLQGAEKIQYDEQIKNGAYQLDQLFANFGKNGPLSSEEIGKLQAELKNAKGLDGIKKVVEAYTANGTYATVVAENLNALTKSGFADRLIQAFRDLKLEAERIQKAIADENQKLIGGQRKIADLESYGRAFGGQTPISAQALGRIDYSSLGEQANIARGQAFGDSAKSQFSQLMQEVGYSAENVQKFSQYNQEAANIQKDLINKTITLSQATERLKNLFSEVQFEKNAPFMFSGEKAAAQQSILEGKLRQGKIQEGLRPADSFFSNLGDNAATTADKINKSFANLASNLQTGFEDAFGAFIDGTKTADQAFQDMLLSISQQIIKEQFSIGMRSLLGGLTGGGGFGGTSDNSGGLLGGVFNSIFGGGKAQGGIIRKYSSGGHVQGGSGTKDDVPAMLTDGEYVLRKSAVNKYGKGMLDMLNSGGMVRGYASGGSISMGLANTFDIFDPQGNLVQNPIGPYALERTISSPEQLKNIPEYTGKYNISNLLSSYGMTREDNPMNDLRSENARTFQGYQQNVSSFKTSYNEAMRQVEEQRKQAQQQADEINSQAMAQYNRSLTNTFIGGLASAGLSAFGAISSLPKAPFGTGLQKLFGGAASGGSSGGSGGTYSLNGSGGMIADFLGKIGGTALGGFGGGGGSSFQPGEQFNDPRYQEQISKQIESAIQKQTFDRAAMGITSPYQSYGGMGGYGGFDGSQIPYYGAGSGINVGLGAPAGLSTFTQNKSYLEQYLTRPAMLVPPTGLVTKPNLMISGLEGYGYGQGSTYGGYAKGGIVKGYADGGEVNKFVKTYYPYAVQAAQRLGTSPEAILAQLAFESNYGKSELSQKSFNLGGIQAQKGYQGQTISMPANADERARGDFAPKSYRSYNNTEEFFNDYVGFLSKDRYSKTIGVADPAQRAQLLYEAEYAGEYPGYSKQIASVAGKIKSFLPNNIAGTNNSVIAGGGLPSSDLVKKPLNEAFYAGYDEYMKNMLLPKATAIAETNAVTNAVTNSQAKSANSPVGNLRGTTQNLAQKAYSMIFDPLGKGKNALPSIFRDANGIPTIGAQSNAKAVGQQSVSQQSVSQQTSSQQYPWENPNQYPWENPNAPSYDPSFPIKMFLDKMKSESPSLYQSVGNLYEQVGLARKNPQIPSYLNRYSSFYGSGKDYYNPGGMSGFNNYMNYLGLGSGTSLSSLSSFQFPMTPTTLSPYAFSSSPFGGGAISYGAGIASAPSTYFSAGSRLGATPSWASRATGGMIYGGTSVKDDVPAMLMGGEYVVRKDAVDRFGQPFFDRLNRGQVTGFAEGGPVGTNLPSLTQNLGQNNGQKQDSQTQMTDALTKLLKSLEQLNRSVEDQTKEIQDQNQTSDNGNTTSSSSDGITNNININVSVGQDGQEGKSSTDSNSEDNGKGGNDQEKLKKTLEKSRMFAELLRQQVLKTIVEEQRPGGVLYQGSKGRDMGR